MRLVSGSSIARYQYRLRYEDTIWLLEGDNGTVLQRRRYAYAYSSVHARTIFARRIPVLAVDIRVGVGEIVLTWLNGSVPHSHTLPQPLVAVPGHTKSVLDFT